MCNNPLLKDPYQQLDDYIDSIPYKKKTLF